MREATAETCDHREWTLLNPWDYIRKYRCNQCSAVATCQCDEAFGAKLRHQLDSVRPTFDPTVWVKVTHGFLPRVCPTCRGEPEPPYARADGYGSPSVFERYYWREIAREAYTHYDGDGMPPKDVWRHAKTRIKALHRNSPKYDLRTHRRGKAPDDLDVSTIWGERVVEDGVGRWRVGDNVERVEELAASALRSRGWHCLHSESYLPRTLFGVFLGLAIHDIYDPKLTPLGFGKRDFSGELIWSMMPLDHHSSAWYKRREAAIKQHIDSIDTSDLDWLLDYWWDAWSEHREYLWAHKPEFKDLARQFLRLAPEKLHDVLLYLAEDFWGHHTGWPDLMGWRGRELRFFEVKGPHDRLSEDQIRWLNDNVGRLGFGFTLIKVKVKQQ